MKGKFDKLEAIRGFAAVYVLATHLWDQRCIILGHNLSFLFKFGQEAVMLFFILSGFVIQYSFNRSKDKSFSTYFKKRFFRIYIPLGIVFITSYILYLNFDAPRNTPILPHLLGNIFMLQDLYNVKPNVICDPFLDNGPLWSLSYEWWFYMIYFFIDKYFKDKSFTVVSIIAIIACVSYIVYPFFANRILMYLIIWWSGVEIAKVFANEKDFHIKNLKQILAVMAICLAILVINLIIHYQPITAQSYPFIEVRHMTFAIVIIFVSLAWKRINWFMFNKTLGYFTFIAPISYTIYISHYFLVIHSNYLSFINNSILQTLVGITICLLFSIIVEKKIYPFVMKFVKFK